MPDQEKDQKPPQPQPTEADLYGQQGNQGQYGQGQYDMDGKPDPNGAQAQNIAPGDQKPNKPASDTPQSPNPEERSKNAPRD